MLDYKFALWDFGVADNAKTIKKVREACLIDVSVFVCVYIFTHTNTDTDTDTHKGGTEAC